MSWTLKKQVNLACMELLDRNQTVFNYCFQSICYEYVSDKYTTYTNYIYMYSSCD